MDDVTHLDTETRIHQDFAYEDGQQAPNELNAAARQVRAAEALEAAVVHKEVAVERDREGVRHTSAEADRESEA